jgi:signal transduction histidine kinase
MKKSPGNEKGGLMPSLLKQAAPGIRIRGEIALEPHVGAQQPKATTFRNRWDQYWREIKHAIQLIAQRFSNQSSIPVHNCSQQETAVAELLRKADGKSARKAQLCAEFRTEFSAALNEYVRGSVDEAFKRSHALRPITAEKDLGLYDLIVEYQEIMKANLLFSSSSDSSLTLDAGAALFAAVLSPFNASEEQIQRIAQTLHDESGQLLASVYIALDELTRDLPESAVPVKRIEDLLNRIEIQLRDLSHELCPTILDDLGFEAALKSLADGVSRRTHIAVEIHCENLDRLSPDLELALYRIAQEALTNIMRHSKATRAVILLREEGDVLKGTIHDNGIGFDIRRVRGKTGRRGLGLSGIEGRINALQGTFSIESDPGYGTKLLFTMPLARKDVYQDLAS